MRPATRKWMFVLVAISLAYAATLRVAPMNELREAHQLVLPPLPKKVSSSALLTPLLALGRAPLVDYLWLRATKLKDEGRIFDAYQLAQWICELQPKFPSVWAFQGWNMAYNISVTQKSAEERWRWVRNGYELIRDKGITGLHVRIKAPGGHQGPANPGPGAQAAIRALSRSGFLIGNRVPFAYGVPL